MHCANCRAPLNAGSRYCNSCGAAIAAPAPPGGERTGAYSGQTLQGRPNPNQTAMPPTYQVPSGTPYPGSQIQTPPAGNKKPIALLAALLLLITGGVAAGTFFLVKKPNQSVTGGQVTQIPVAPGVQQAAGTQAPQAPGVMATPGGRPPAPGQPVTGTVQKPADPNMAPSVVMAPGSTAPGAPSVTQVTGVQTPTAPAVIAAPNQPQPAAPPLTAAPNRPTPKPAAPVVVDNTAAIDRYLQWLRFAENQRQELHTAGQREQMAQMEQFYQVLLSPDDPDWDRKMMAFMNPQNSVNRTLNATVTFWSSFARTKPPVPEDCKWLDEYYCAAGRAELQQTQQTVRALANRDLAALTSIGRMGSRTIGYNLKKADAELEKIVEVRRRERWFIDYDSGGGGALGGLSLPGL